MQQNTNKLTKGLTGIAGEYFVAAELSRRGYMASILLRNNDSIDIHASNPLSGKIYAIQVKTSQSVKNNWPLGEKAENFRGDNVFYIFVSFKSIEERPSYYIVPSEVVADYVKNDHKKWLDTPGKKGQPHKDNSMRNFKDATDKYLEKWDLLS
jgi:hypothetical protein